MCSSERPASMSLASFWDWVQFEYCVSVSNFCCRSFFLSSRAVCSASEPNTISTSLGYPQSARFRYSLRTPSVRLSHGEKQDIQSELPLAYLPIVQSLTSSNTSVTLSEFPKTSCNACRYSAKTSSARLFTSSSSMSSTCATGVLSIGRPARNSFLAFSVRSETAVLDALVIYRTIFASE